MPLQPFTLDQNSHFLGTTEDETGACPPNNQRRHTRVTSDGYKVLNPVACST
jgi:hypothetical protein